MHIMKGKEQKNYLDETALILANRQTTLMLHKNQCRGMNSRIKISLQKSRKIMLGKNVEFLHYSPHIHVVFKL